MSAFDFLSLPTTRESTDPTARPTADPAAAPEPTRSFREELADTEPTREPAAARETRETETADAPPRLAEDSRETAEPAVEASAAEEPTAAQAEPVAESTDAAAVEGDADVESPAEDGESRVAELVVELISAFEEVLESNPLLQPAGENTAAATDGDPANAYPGLTALFEALSAVAGLNGNATSGNATAGNLATTTPAAGLAAAPPLTPAPVAPGLANPADAAALAVTPEQATAQNPSGGDLGQSSQNPAGNGNPSANTANTLATDAARPAAAAAPNFTAAPTPVVDAAGSTVQALTPTPNTSSNGANAASALNAAANLVGVDGDPDALNSARLTRGLNNAVNQQGGSVTLRLTPPEMGTVRIQLNLSGTNVSAQFHAETSSAQRLLTQQLGQLRTTLEGQGLNVERLGVQSMASSSNSSGLQNQSNNDNTQSQAQANADGRSRGQFSGQSSEQGRQDQSGDGDAANVPADFTQLVDANADLTEAA